MMRDASAAPLRRHLVSALALVALATTLASAACGDDTSSSSTGSGAGGAAGTGSGASTTGGTSTGEGAGDPCDGRPTACFDAATCYADPPTGVSFEADVLPIFVRSCALSTACHGNLQSPVTGSGYRPYLGASGDGESDVAAILEAIVGVESFIDPSKNVVEPGDWEASTLMNKVDGALDDCSNLDCPDGCLRLMPQGLSQPLPVAERNVMRSWIAEGALAN